MFKLKRATQYTLFATGLMIFSIFFLYIMLVADISAHLRSMGLSSDEYTVMGPRHAKADEYAIRRVMRILLTNAVKYSEAEKRIKITAVQNSGKTEITVKDNGIGIPKEHLTRIFERFYRVDPSRNRKTGSSGLGLAIAQEIITAHSGEISAHSDGKGTAISFYISS
ncbi:MAG: ATP-binding protein [Defluviitaleaceae bacterium]|nr:ATP-binding protein [Defluviitaleaceae bacterium]